MKRLLLIACVLCPLSARAQGMWSGVPKSWDYLGGFRFGSAAQTTGAISIAAREQLMIVVNIAGYSGGDIASLRFNADATAANYHARYVTFTNAAPPVLGNTNFTTGADIQLGPTGITAGRQITIMCSNMTTLRKICNITSQEEATAQATFAAMYFGYGEWFNTTAQITSIELRTNGGTITMSASSSISIWGYTPP